MSLGLLIVLIVLSFLTIKINVKSSTIDRNIEFYVKTD